MTEHRKGLQKHICSNVPPNKSSEFKSSLEERGKSGFMLVLCFSRKKCEKQKQFLKNVRSRKKTPTKTLVEF